MWSNFEASAVEDETISNVFSSRSLFQISSDEEVEKYPDVKASVQCGKMAIAIDKSLLLLEDELVAKCSFLSFGATIEAIAMSSSGNLIVCGLSDGEVHGVHIKGLLLFSVCVNMDDVTLLGGTFRSIHQLDHRFYFSCRNGSIYSLSDIDEATLESVCNITVNENETIACEKAILDDVTIQRISKGRSLANVDCVVLLFQMSAVHISAQNNPEDNGVNHALVIYGDQNTLNFKTSSNDVTRITLPAHLGSLKQIFNLEHYIIALTTSGHLLEICPFTRTFHVPQSFENQALLIEDILVMECNEENIELLLLTKPTDESRFIKIVEYPSLKCKNEVDVPNHAWLVHQPKCAVNLYYLAAHELNKNKIPSMVNMMLVSETDPTDRFKKLIAKGRLEEAEEFGVQFELCLQPIYEAKAKRILVEMCNSHQEIEQSDVDGKFQTLLQLMTKIENKSFFKNHRMINLSSRQILERYLREIQKRLSFEDDEQDMLQIDEQLHRLKTLAIIDPYECNTDWQKFIYDNNLIRMVKSLFNADMPTACLIWKRHSSSILPLVSENDLRMLLGYIPGNTKPFNMVQWLRQFTPLVSNTHPSIMPFITDWSIEMTRKLQYSPHWPDIGLEFSTKILEIFEEIRFTYSDVRRQQERNVGKLRELVNALQDLSVLKTNYNMGFTLDNYMQDTLDATALSILQHVQLDKLRHLVENFMYPIFQEKGRQPLEVIKQYIGQLVASRQSSSNWLERAMACIDLLHNEDSRLECALSVLQNAPVPWPDTLAPLIRLRNSTHPVAMKINAEYEIQVIKIMKVKYGWPADSSADINLEKFMMRIVKLNLPDMLEDIRTLTKAAPHIAISANFNCCYQMARRGQIESAYEFFKSLTGGTKNAKECADVVELFANILESSSSVSFVNDSKKQEYQNVLELFKLFLPHADSVYERRYLMIKHCFQLRHNFDIRLRCSSELVSLKRRHELLDEAIERIIERAQATLNVSSFIASQNRELCAALNLSPVFGLHRICERIGCLPLSCALAYHVVQFIDCTPSTVGDFINLALELLVQQIGCARGSTHENASSMQLISESDPLSFPLAYDLLTSALLHEPSRRRDLVELIMYIRVAVIHYSVDAVKQHYDGKEQAVNEHICRALDGTTVALGDTTINFSCALNDTIDVKPVQPTTSKKRYSVSMFDEVEVQPVHQVHLKKNIGGQLPIVKFLARTLLLMVIEAEPSNSLLMQMRRALAENVVSDVENARADFFVSLEYLTKAKEHDVWYVMSQYLLEYQKYNCRKKRIINEGFITLQLRRIFRNAISNKDANFIELFTMLVSDREALALLEKLSTEVKTDLQKINFLTLSAMYSEHTEDMENLQLLRSKRLKLYYYLEFCQQDPRIRGKFNADMDNIEDLLKQFHNKKLDVQLLERMSKDFGLDYQRILVTQVLSILSSQELRFDVKRDTFGDEELVVLSSAQEMREMCQPYINEIKNVELLTSKLKLFIEEINIYFYELYMCVVNILMYFDAAPKEMEIWTNILHFLRHKMISRRRSRPGQMETDMWLKSQKENGVLPKISRYRLPFKAIIEQPLKDILDSELNVDNCQSWFPLIQMYTALKGSKDSSQNCDYFCMSAVKNSIEYKSKSESESWSLHPTNNAFLKSILRLVEKVRNPNKAFLILYFVANYARDGADQVEAHYECWKFVKEKGELITDAKCQEQVAKVKRRYPIQKTQHLLNIYGLTDEKLMCLIENPIELIYSLYHHELILTSSKVDINALVKEIAKLHDLCLDTIQYRLLQKWLSVTMETADGTMLEETLMEEQHWTEQANGGDTISSQDASENVSRAFYILDSWPKAEAVKFLVGVIFKGGSVNTSTQLQMYECYSKLNDGSNSFTNTISQRQFIGIKCVHDLKALGYKSNLEKFSDDHCDKIEILKMIWQRNAQNPLSLEVMANICLGFDIHLPKIWNGILKRMVMFHMVDELNALLDVLSCRPPLLHLEGLALAWDYVLCHPLTNAVQTRSFAQEEQLHKTLLRLQGCPVVHALNLVQFAEHCVLIQRPHMAAALLSFCQKAEQRQEIRKKILSRPVENLRQQILNLEDAGLLPVVLNFALKELNL